MHHAALPLTIFYDASCPVCRDEIALLKQYDANDALQMEDCSPANYAPPADAPTGVTRDAMMSLIHARDANGAWLVGAPVFAAAYAACGFPLFEKLWGAKSLQPMWRVVYPLIANNRMLLSKLGASHALSWVLGKMYARSVRAKTFCATDRDGCA
jgi:predicted DCC family thiol-disulfide oxidoreductase YuxK